MIGVPFSSGLDISRQLLDQGVQPGKIGFEPFVVLFRQKDIAIFSEGQMSICCFYQVAIFQAVLITLVRCAFLHKLTAQFCTVCGTLSRMWLGLEKP